MWFGEMSFRGYITRGTIRRGNVRSRELSVRGTLLQETVRRRTVLEPPCDMGDVFHQSLGLNYRYYWYCLSIFYFFCWLDFFFVLNSHFILSMVQSQKRFIFFRRFLRNKTYFISKSMHYVKTLEEIIEIICST